MSEKNADFLKPTRKVYISKKLIGSGIFRLTFPSFYCTLMIIINQKQLFIHQQVIKILNEVGTIRIQVVREMQGNIISEIKMITNSILANVRKIVEQIIKIRWIGARFLNSIFITPF